MNPSTIAELQPSSPRTVCLERLGESARPIIKCVALDGASKGLGIDDAGVVNWRQSSPGACRICVTRDNRLVLVRQADAFRVRLIRADRYLDAPVGKLVILLHLDEIEIGKARYRVHDHGPATRVIAPRLLRGAACGAAIAALLGAGCQRSATPERSVGAADASYESSAPDAFADGSLLDSEGATAMDASIDSSEVDASGDAAADAFDGGRPEAGVRIAPKRVAVPQKRQPIEVRDLPPFSD